MAEKDSWLWDKTRKGLLWLLVTIGGANALMNGWQIKKINDLSRDQPTVHRLYEDLQKRQNSQSEELQQIRERNADAKDVLQREGPNPQNLTYMTRSVLRDAQRVIDSGRQMSERVTGEDMFARALKEKIKRLEYLIGQWREREKKGEQQGTDKLLEMVNAAEEASEALLKMYISADPNPLPYDDSEDNLNLVEAT